MVPHSFPGDAAHVAEHALAQLRELIGPDPELLRLQERYPSLSLARGYLTRVLRAGLAVPEHTAEVAMILASVDVAIRADLTRRMRVHAQHVSGLTRAVRAISGAGGALLPDVVTRELCTAVGYSKAMFSLISGSSWSPMSVSVNPELGDGFHELIAAVDGHRISLRDAPREAELVRKRRSFAVSPAEIHRHTYRPLLDLSRSAAYLAVPVVVGERAVGIVHVDRQDSDLSDADFHLVGALAEVCALATESQALRGRIAEQNQRTEAELQRLARSLRDLEESEVTLGEVTLGEVTAPGSPPVRIDGDPDSTAHPAPLSPRERDVLALMATGATNAAISRRLCISDGTVKSHAQQIFKKLNVATRAEAAAWHAGRRLPDRIPA
ncbi:LuxR C-terminal-related transcriptional regulator [Nocardia sp. R6R-6]|uniref:LuxR C-terminal-related transcriptional regulator n=1 Tax=Nocardia sp. R6R-6 TaxID=3459303 RepID=UPI00403DDBF9